MKYAEEFKALNRHASEAKKKGWCIQCQYPWYDGTCDCGHFEEPSVGVANIIASTMINKNGWNGDLTFKRFNKK